MSDMNIRWEAGETYATGYAIAGLVEENLPALKNSMSELGGPAKACADLKALSTKLEQDIGRVKAGSPATIPTAEMLLALEESPNIIRATREAVKRTHRSDLAVRAAFGVGSPVAWGNNKSELGALTQIVSAAAVYPHVLVEADLPADLIPTAAKHAETLRQIVAADAPPSDETNRLVADRNATQLQIQKLVDKAIAAAAAHAWRTPELVKKFKAALPSRRPAKKKGS